MILLYLTQAVHFLHGLGELVLLLWVFLEPLELRQAVMGVLKARVPRLQPPQELVPRRLVVICHVQHLCSRSPVRMLLEAASCQLEMLDTAQHGSTCRLACTVNTENMCSSEWCSKSLTGGKMTSLPCF